MKHIVLSLLMLFAVSTTLAQEEKETKEYFKYNIFSYSVGNNFGGINIDVDNGQTIDALRNEKGKKIYFRTPASALTYLISLGWELYKQNSITEGSISLGNGNTNSKIYWIMRKPCTKEEFEEMVNNAIKK